MTILHRINALTPTHFENLVFDYATAIGFKNVTWRTPGADGGRDIEAYNFPTDLSGYQFSERWFIECKLYSSSIDWPTVWAKIAHAEAMSADVLLIATNSNPSPTCESRIAEWNNTNRKPRIRVWRGYEFQNLLNLFPNIISSYGLSDERIILEASLLDLAQITSYLAKTLVSSIEFEMPLESSLPLLFTSELLSERMNDINSYGKFVHGHLFDNNHDQKWLDISCELCGFEETGLLAILSFAKHALGANTVSLSQSETGTLCIAKNCRFSFSESSIRNLRKISILGFIQIISISQGATSFEISSRY
ncbi:MAG: restriction endonuclease [Novosphingobium sp.]